MGNSGTLASRSRNDLCPLLQWLTSHSHLQAELLYKTNPKLLNQFQYCEREAVPFLVIVGEQERANGGVKIRDGESRVEVRAV